MNRCVAFAGPGTVGKPAGPVPLMSKRNTTATYFDSHGIMRIAQPYELRPNYVYKNGVWVQEGWLREGKATNLLSGVMPDPNDKTHETLPEGNEYELIAGSEVVQWSPTKAAQTLDFCLFTTPAYITTQSFFIKSLSGALGVTLSRPWYWGPGITVNTGTGEVSGNTNYLFVENCGNGWWRMGGARISENQAATWTRLQVDAPAVVLISCNMLEAASAPASGLLYPTSWIPYGQTRAAD